MFETSSLCFKYLLSIAIASTANYLPKSAVEPIALLRQSSISSSLSGAEIATVTGTDVVHPTLSPDGKFLAYADVLVKKRVENTSISILNLETKQKFTLIDDKTAAKYGTHKAYVSGMDWSRADRLIVSINDGDVDTTKLTFDPQTRKLISTKYGDGGGLSDEQLLERAALRQVAGRIVKIFPKIDRSALTSAIESNRALLINDTVLLQGKLFDRADNLWLLDLSQKSVKQLFETGDPLATASLDNINRVGKSIFFTLTPDRATPVLFRYHSDRVKQIGKLPGLDKLTRPMKVAYHSSQRTILIGYIYRTYEEGNNLLYVLEKGRIVKSTEFAKLYDVRVNTAGTRIAYCYWSKGKRQIVVKELFSSSSMGNTNPVVTIDRSNRSQAGTYPDSSTT